MEKTVQKIVRVQRMQTLTAIRSRETVPVHVEKRAQIVPTVSITYTRVYMFFLLMTKHMMDGRTAPRTAAMDTFR